MMITFITNYKNIGIDKELNPVYVKNWIKKQIRESEKLLDCEKKVMLEYPVVYIHAWEVDHVVSVYVGETYNLTQRLGEHLQSNEGWHDEWRSAIKKGKAISCFFSCEKMNESMCLDLEHSLVILLKQQNVIRMKTISTTDPQDNSNYSNKNERDVLLKEIWNEISNEISKFLFGEAKLCSFDSLDKKNLTSSDNKKLPEDLQFRYVNPFENDVKDYIERIETELITNYAMVYLYIWKVDNEIKTYVGEANHIAKRTEQHLKGEENWEKEWKNAINKGNAWLLMFGHKEFNKSMIKDIENRFILYTKFLGISQNHRHNERGKYDNQSKAFSIFLQMVKKLVEWQENKFYKFKKLEDVQKEAIGLASPFYELTKDQRELKSSILQEIDESLVSGKKTLIILYGGAGTGKTVLLSNLLFDLYDDEECKCDFMVNNKELAPTYRNMIKTWQLGKTNATIEGEVVYYASDYFNKKGGRAVLLIDEGHLLFTQDYMRAKEQLSHIMDNATCTVLVFDPLQFIDKNKSWTGKCGFNSVNEIKKSFEELFNEKGSDIKINVSVHDLDKQLRMKCEEDTFNWIKSLSVSGTKLGKLGGKVVENNGSKLIKKDKNDYYVGIYRNMAEFYKDLCKKREEDKDAVCLATYDWKNDPESCWYTINSKSVFHWHDTGKGKNVKDKNGELSSEAWYRRAGVAADEVGAVHDIQGFDLSYAYVIIGPSIKYSPTRGNLKGKEGIQIYANKHKTNHDINIILNELRILLTRGAKGIMVYAVDEKLREALYNSLK